MNIAIPVYKKRQIVANATVDADQELLLTFRWLLRPNGQVFRREKQSNGAWKQIYLHRQCIPLPNWRVYVYFRDGNPLNCLRSNLIISRNKKKTSGKTSRFLGVSKHKGIINRWQASISFMGLDISLGNFKEEATAARAYDKGVEKYFGKFGLTNEALGLL